MTTVVGYIRTSIDRQDLNPEASVSRSVERSLALRS